MTPLLSFDDALTQLLEAATPLTGHETVALAVADGRVLATDLAAPLDVPGFDNSAMDGYALHLSDFTTLPARLPVTQRIAAGAVGTPLSVGEAARIFTGAPVPPGTNAVVPQEEAVAGDGWVELQASVRPGQHIRLRGNDIALGDRLVSAGTRLTPQHLALLASVGIAEVMVRPRLRVGVLFTGDELVLPGEPLPPGAIYNANRFSLLALLERLGCTVSDYGNIADDPGATEVALAQAAAENDVVMTSGGVSVGEEDHVKAVVERLGQLDLWRIAIKPGKPLAFGRIGQAAFLGLPGNPVSTFLTFCLLARPFLLKSQGAQPAAPRRLSLPAAFSWPQPDKRREFLRGRLEMGTDGMLQVTIHSNQGSAVMSALCWADGLVDLTPGRTVRPGERVDFLPLENLL
ncbi:molybdopterin molybdotransferase MoeA [Chitinimonas lacunae]|uniref:Molybdopterin molybdenumtransferase n=1 Tax=Chitinimonas lacunae TaxID=1963018 RepID=A0ABV8MTK1_9NEIS